MIESQRNTTTSMDVQLHSQTSINWSKKSRNVPFLGSHAMISLEKIIVLVHCKWDDFASLDYHHFWKTLHSM